MGLGVALPLVTSLSNPASAAIAAGVGLIALVDKIGQGRKAANKMTGPGAPQDIINKQLAAISASQATDEEKAQATDKAWRGFLTAANEFAAANPKQAQVVKQAIYQTPKLTSTVRGLLGKDPLAAEYTSAAAPGMATGFAGKNPGPSVWGTIAKAGAAAATPFVMDALTPNRAISSIGSTDTGFDWQGPVLSAATSGATKSPSLLSRLLPQFISAGTSLTGGLIASRAASKAADVQATAADRAAELQASTAERIAAMQGTTAERIAGMQRDAGQEALGFQRDVLAQQQANAQPWIDAGTGALRRIGDMGAFQLTDTERAPFRMPTAQEAMADPGIQFQLERGRKAVEGSMRAKGLAFSPAAMLELDRRSQGIAATGYNDVVNRRMAEYQSQGDVINRRLMERQANLNPNLAVAGFGQDATGRLGSDLGSFGSRAGDITMGTARSIGDIETGAARTIGDIGLSTSRNIGDLSTSAAAARASGYVGGANALGTTIGNIGNNILDYATMQEWMRRMGGNA